MLLKIKTYKINDGKQYVIPFFKSFILIGRWPNLFYIRFGDTNKGFQVTSKPLFSIRNGYKKSIKLKRYYISKL
jgi:hypothetical protein